MNYNGVPIMRPYDILHTENIKEYVYTINTYYPKAYLSDFKEEFAGLLNMCCMTHTMTIGGNCCQECSCLFRPEKEFDIITKNGRTYFEEYFYCAIIHGLK